MACEYCGCIGHTSPNCRHFHNLCFVCGAEDHFIRNCPKNRRLFKNCQSASGARHTANENFADETRPTVAAESFYSSTSARDHAHASSTVSRINLTNSREERESSALLLSNSYGMLEDECSDEFCPVPGSDFETSRYDEVSCSSTNSNVGEPISNEERIRATSEIKKTSWITDLRKDFNNLQSQWACLKIPVDSPGIINEEYVLNESTGRVSDNSVGRLISDSDLNVSSAYTNTAAKLPRSINNSDARKKLLSYLEKKFPSQTPELDEAILPKDRENVDIDKRVIILSGVIDNLSDVVTSIRDFSDDTES